jgi:PhnB protein
MRLIEPDEKSIMHAEIKIGDSIMMLGEEHPEMGCQGPKSLGGTPMYLHLYVNDADQAFTRAMSAGAKADKPVTELLWGDRCGQFTDQFDYRSNLTTRKENLTPEEIRKRAGGGALLKGLGRPGN